jgi:translation elongation factor EF-G
MDSDNIIKIDQSINHYRETIIDKSSIICLAKSDDKYTRLYITAELMDQQLVEDIENKKIDVMNDNLK